MLRVRKGKLLLLAAAVAGAVPSLSFGQNSSWTFVGGFGSWQGSWNVNTNWSPNSAFPNSNTGTAAFGPQQLLTGAGGSGTVIIDNTTITVKAINFMPVGTTASSVTITGNGSLNIVDKGVISVDNANGGSFNTATITTNMYSPAQSSWFKTGAGNLVISGSNNFGAGTVGSGLSVDAGTLIAVGANSLNGLSIITTSNSGVLELRNATVNAFGIGASSTPGVDGAIHVAAGNSTWNGRWFLAGNASVGVDATRTFTVNGDFVDASGTLNGLTKTGGNGTMIINGIQINGPLAVNAGTLRVNTGSPVSIVGGLSITTAKLDITNTKMIVKGGGIASRDAITAALKTGQGAHDDNDQANWDGNGMISSTARANNVIESFDKYSIGSVLNSDLDDIGIGGAYSTFGGVSVGASDVLVRYTYNGDADLDGKVTGDDYTYWLNGFTHANPPTLTGWANGDFNYDGLVNGDDYTAWLNGFIANSPVLPSVSLAALQVQFPGPSSLVPEPNTAILAAGVLGGFLSRRRRAR